MSLNLPRTVAVKAAGWFDQGAIKIDVLRVCGLGLGWAWVWGKRWGVGEMEKLGISLSPVCSECTVLVRGSYKQLRRQTLNGRIGN